MKIGIGIYAEKRMVGKGDIVKASNSLNFEGSDCTGGKEYKVSGISTTNNLLIKNDKGVIKEYATVFFQ